MKHSLETRRKLSEAMKGRKVSEEHRKKVSEARKRYFAEHPEARKALSEKLMGHKGYGLGKKRGPLSERTKRRVSRALKGKPKSEEFKRKISGSGNPRYGDHSPRPRGKPLVKLLKGLLERSESSKKIQAESR